VKPKPSSEPVEEEKKEKKEQDESKQTAKNIFVGFGKPKENDENTDK
jgi:hypothetical protein